MGFTEKLLIMNGHEITLEGLREWQSEYKIAYATDSKANKQIYCTLRGSYEVWHNGEKILETMQPFTATEKYNSI